MKRILSVGLFILMAFTLFVNNSVKVEADNKDEIVVTIEAIVDGENTEVELYKDPVSYGSNLEVDLREFEETFAFWIVDGMVDLERDVETTFIATNDFNAIAVFTDEKELDVYVDHSGELLKAVYDGDEVTVDQPTKIGYEFDDWALIVDVNQVKVHKATYTLNHEPVTINGTSYDYNSIVTLTSDDEEFSHWEVDGKVVSYNKDYTFTALRDLTITEVTEGTVSKETIVTLTNLNDYREGYSTYLAQIELHNNDELVEYGLEVDGTLRKANNLHKDTNEFLISTEKDWNKVRSYIIVKRDNEFITLFDEEAEVAESFEVSDEFTGYYTGEGTPTFGDLQGEDFGITSIEETSPGVYTIVLSGTVKVFDDNYDNPNRFGHGGIVALLGLKYNLPPAYANAEGLTDIGVVWTTPIQSQAAFDLGYKWRGSVDTGNYDSLILTSNVYSLKDEDFLKFAVNWGGTKDEETGYVEYILDIRNVVFEEVSVTGVTVNEEALTLMALEEAQLEATIAPTNAVNKEVTWSSSNETVATVDENGLVTGLRAGEAIITVETVDGRYTAQTTVTVFEAAESFEVNDEFTGYYTGEGTPTFGDLQGEDFGITSIKETSPGVYTIVLSGTVKVFDDNHDNPNRFGHGGIVALLGLKYNLPPAYANADGLTDIGVVWTTPIQSQAAFDSGYKWRGSVDTGNYDSLILTSNVYSLKDEDFLKFAVNWGGTKDEGTGYVEYILDISDVVFEEVSVTGVAVNEEALVLIDRKSV